MKKQNAITIIASALLVAGCAHHERETASYDTMSSPGYESMGSYRNGNSYNYSSTTQTPTTGLAATTPSTSDGKNPSDARTITSGTAKSDQPVGEGDQALIVVVQKAITDEPAVSTVMPNVNVTAQNGAVTLTGTVANEQQKQQIENVVKNATGVTSVDNQLQVAYKPTSEVETSRIYSNSTSQAEGAATSPQGTSSEQSKSQEALDSSKSTSSTSQAEGAATSPQGTSSEQSKSQDASDSSKSTIQTVPEQKGAATTQSDISSSQALTPTGNTGDTFNANVQGTTTADQSVAQKVIEQLRADSTLGAVLPLVRITIADGKATIKGAAKSEDQKQQIEKTVQQVSGVNSVDNQLKVSATTNDSTNP